MCGRTPSTATTGSPVLSASRATSGMPSVYDGRSSADQRFIRAATSAGESSPANSNRDPAELRLRSRCVGRARFPRTRAWHRGPRARARSRAARSAFARLEPPHIAQHDAVRRRPGSRSEQVAVDARHHGKQPGVGDAAGDQGVPRVVVEDHRQVGGPVLSTLRCRGRAARARSGRRARSAGRGVPRRTPRGGRPRRPWCLRDATRGPARCSSRPPRRGGGRCRRACDGPRV